MTRKLIFATIILSFVVAHAIAWQRLESIRRQDAPSAISAISDGD